jgi:hypothetical protein
MAVTGHNRPASLGNRVAIAFIVVGILSLLTLGTAFGLLALGIEDFWVVFPVGFGGVLPIALGLVVVWTSPDN